MKKIIFAMLTCLAFLVAGCETTPDPVVTGVQSALKQDQYVGKFDIKAAHDAFGEVTLTGKVNNDFQKYQAETIAKKVAGVKTVKNQITLN
ncbi:MAG TPA: BON domain-containing protein [Burkholderiales bacterium]|nr:BON domain-containing protein [Burkholderiales bacterium]